MENNPTEQPVESLTALQVNAHEIFHPKAINKATVGGVEPS